MSKRSRKNAKNTAPASAPHAPVPTATPTATIVELPPSDPLRRDADHLTAIARRHAAIALAGPIESRAARLEACRVVWINYAAAFTAGAALQKRFADDMQEITRALIAAQADHSDRTPLVSAAVLTIDELRPLLRQIIGQA